MGMRVDETGENYASAEIEFFRAARFLVTFDAAARSDGGDAVIANQQCAIANQAQFR